MSKRVNIGPCSVDGCEVQSVKRGMCGKHYDRMRLTGTTECWTDLSLEDRFMRNVEETDGCWLWTAYINSEGYGKMRVGGPQLFAHRIAYNLFVGEIPEGMFLDHICGVRNCVNVEHLRLATIAQNNQYKVTPNPKNTSGYRGVHKASNGKWAAQVRKDNHSYYKGGFNTPEEANECAKQMRAELYDFPDFEGEVA